MGFRRRRSRTISLREAAAAIFGLTAVLPLLVFLFVLSHFEIVKRTQAQIGLLLSLFIAILGFVLFRVMVDRIARLAQPAEARKPATVPGLGALAEVVRIRRILAHLLKDLQTSTDDRKDLMVKIVTLNEVVELAARSPKMQDLLDLVLERVMRALRATVGSIMLLDPKKQTLRVVAARGHPEGAVAGVEVKVGEEIAGKVAQLKEAILVDNIETDPRLTKPNDPKYGSGSFLSAPIRVGERLIGVINLARKKDPAGGPSPLASAPFTPVDLRFLNALMIYIASAVDHVRLLEETRESATHEQELIHELKVAEEQLLRGETLRAMGALVEGLTDHLKNLLAVALGQIRFVDGEVDQPQVRHALRVAERAAREAVELVRRVREFSQELPVSEAIPLDLNRLTQEALQLTRPHWQDEAQLRGIQIRASLELGQVPPIRGDPASLREALMSLLLNASDALPNGGQITVRTWASAQEVLCSVADTGVGMCEEIRRHALEPFFTTNGPKRAGLGLSVAHGIIQRHGGDLVIESAEGRGTTVTIRLPLPPAESGPQPETLPGSVSPYRARSSAPK